METPPRTLRSDERYFSGTDRSEIVNISGCAFDFAPAIIVNVDGCLALGNRGHGGRAAQDYCS